MSVKIRLKRKGRKGRPFYHIVAADSRTKRDGKVLERIGSYNPMTNPASITLDVEKAVQWLENGAQPTDTAKAILSYKGALYKKHLNRGVRKGAFSQEEADKKFEAWIADKEAKINAKKDGLAKVAEKEAADRLKAEKEVNEARVAAATEVEAPEVAEEEVTEAPATEEAPAAEAATEEAATEEAPATEEATKEEE